MKIATWNVNSLTARLQHVLDWTAASPVDVLCLQELKLTDDKFPHEAIEAAGYTHRAVFGQKTYNGVAILSRHPLHSVVKNITGFDDTPVATTLWPELTTIRQPVSAMGRAAIDLVLEQIRRQREGRAGEAVHQVMKYTLVRRDSAAAPD